MKKVPAYLVIDALGVESGFWVRWRRSWGGRFSSGDETPRRPITLKLDRVPFVEAIHRYSKIDVYHGFSTGESITFIPDLAFHEVAFASSGLFGFKITELEQTIRSDFSEEKRSCELGMDVWWQPDVLVFQVHDMKIAEMVDDLGNDLKGSAENIISLGIHNRTPVYSVTARLPPRKARTIARLRGTVEIEVPGETIECTLTDIHRNVVGPVEVGDYVVTGVRKVTEEHVEWRLSVAPREEKAKIFGVVEAKLAFKDESLQESAREPTTSTSKGKGSVSFTAEESADVESVRFKIVRNTARVKAEFDFEDIDLGRP